MLNINIKMLSEYNIVLLYFLHLYYIYNGICFIYITFRMIFASFLSKSIKIDLTSMRINSSQLINKDIVNSIKTIQSQLKTYKIYLILLTINQLPRSNSPGSWTASLKSRSHDENTM